MRAKEERLILIQKIAVGIMFLSVILLLLLGELLMPKEDPTESGECILLEAEWERVYDDGTREKIEVPGHYDAERDKTFRIETTLPLNQNNTWICMRASQQDMYVFVDGQLRKEYTTKETRLFGRNSASAFVFFRILEEDAGKVLAIETISDSEYTGFLNEIYTGDKYDIAHTLMRQCFVVIVVSVYMFILSSITVLVGYILRVVYKIRVDITYLGWGIMMLSLAMITESRIRQFFLPNASVASYVGFLLTILIPYPFMVYVSRIQKRRYEKAYKILSLCVALNFIISTILQILNIIDLADSMIVSYAIIVIMVVMIGITICLDIQKGKLKEYGELVFGLIVMIVVTVWETIVTLVPKLPYPGGVALSIGLIVLLFMAGCKTARDMLAIEREKQLAIVASEAKAKFIANMSHEIRTPINTIIGMNEMILRENQDEAVAEYARNVQNASSLLLGLINDILDFSKIEAGKMELLETEYYLSKTLTDIMEGIQIKADSKNLTIQSCIDETLPTILKGDEIRIRQILNNLLSNAVKYTQQGTITLTVKGIREASEFILFLAVEDTGIGIKAEDLEKLFSSFQRLEEHKNRYIEGTGLGLNITKQLVELMGGSIEVKSEYGKGSCFTVKIPQQVLNDAPIGNLKDAYQRDTIVKTEVRSKLYAPEAEILVVDDNQMNLNVVKALLKRTGIKLTMATGGAECLELCKIHKYDLILMDHMMPTPDGVETLHMLRKDADGPNQNTKVIVLTANAIAGMAEKYIAEGFTDYLSKPVVADKLENMIYKYLPKEKLGDVKREDATASMEAVDKREQAVSLNQGAIFVIDKEKALEYCAGSEEVYQEMQSEYINQGSEYLRKLGQYYRERDWKNYKIIVHALKSTSLLIGATAFSEKAKKLEQAAGEENEQVLLADGEQFLQEYRELLKQLMSEG